MLNKGLILHLQRLSTEDGPGIRTTVFFKGCPLRCAWCHNPESLTQAPQVQWLKARCIGCNACIQVCPQGALRRSEEGIERDLELCQVCGACVDECPANAMELLGKQVDVESLAADLVKDRMYYEKSGGGVTLSGGEPTLQATFSEALLKKLKGEGITTALDTCGLCSTTVLERLLPLTDLVLFDLKLIDAEQHLRFTGVNNKKILENLIFIKNYLQEKAPHIGLWIRTPLIPGATASVENIGGIGEFIAHNMERTVQRWDLLAFNNLCRDKYRRLGMDWRFSDTPLLRQEEIDELGTAARSSGVDASIVQVSGAARLPDQPRLAQKEKERP